MIMIRFLFQIFTSLLFLIANVLTLLAILAMNRRTEAKSGQEPSPDQGNRLLPASDILGWEFEYARVTASEAMEQRHTMVNFYLLVTGIVASAVVAALGRGAGLPKAVGTVLLWLLCGVGWLYFLAIIRLRQAWHDSARTMNQIKEFYIRHATEFDEKTLRPAFRWQEHTLPGPDKPWTVFFYSAALISFLNSVAYIAGGALLGWGVAPRLLLPALGLLTLFGLAFFAFHLWLYLAFLKPKSSREATSDAPSEDG